MEALEKVKQGLEKLLAYLSNRVYYILLVLLALCVPCFKQLASVLEIFFNLLSVFTMDL